MCHDGQSLSCLDNVAVLLVSSWAETLFASGSSDWESKEETEVVGQQYM